MNTQTSLTSNSTESSQTDILKRYSIDNEEFPFRSKEEALDALVSKGSLSNGEIYWVADFRQIMPSDLSDVRYITNEIGVTLKWLANDAASLEFTSDCAEAKLELKQFIAWWVEKHINLAPYFVMIGHSRECVVTHEDCQNSKATA